MDNLKKVRLMANLAIYDKHYGEEDRKITSMFRRDYVYIKNLSIRLGVLFGCFIIFCIYYGYKILVMDTDMFELFSKSELIKTGILILVLLIIYTVIGTIINRRRYHLAEKRCERYDKMISKLYDEPKQSKGRE